MRADSPKQLADKANIISPRAPFDHI